MKGSHSQQNDDGVETGQTDESAMGALESMLGEDSGGRDTGRQKPVQSAPLRHDLAVGGTRSDPPDVPGGAKKHSATQTKRLLPARARILVTVMGDDGHVRPVDYYNVVDIAPNGDLEQFIKNIMVPKYGRDVDYPIYLVDDGNNRKFWTTISFAKPKDGSGSGKQSSAPASTDPIKVMQDTKKMLEDERRKAKEEERAHFAERERERSEMRTEFNRELAELRRSVVAGDRDPSSALVAMKVLKALQDQSEGASDKTIAELREQIHDLKNIIAKREDDSGNGKPRGGDRGSDMAYMMIMSEMLNTLRRDDSLSSSPPIGGGRGSEGFGGVPVDLSDAEPRQPRQSSLKEAQELLAKTFEMITPFIKNGGQSATGPQVDVAAITDRMNDKFELMMQRVSMENERKLMAHERRIDELMATIRQQQALAQKPANDIDTLVGTLLKLKEASGNLFGGGSGEMGSLEFWSQVTEQAPAIFESIGDMYERSQRVKIEAAQAGIDLSQQASGGGGGSRPPSQQQQKKPRGSGEGKYVKQSREESDKKVLTKFALALRDAKTDQNIFDAIAFFVSRMHNHKNYGKFIRAIVVSKGSDRRSYVEQIVNHFFAGKPPDGLIDRICKVIADNEADMQNFLAMNAGEGEKRTGKAGEASEASKESEGKPESQQVS